VRPSTHTFGRRLRDQRERHGVTLETIAANTKISASLLAGLERGDVSAWPNGIFRRAFVREYATAIGVPPEPTVAEFARLFPDQGAVEAAVAPQPASELRLTLALDAQGVTAEAFTRVMVALLEVSLVVAFSVGLAWFESADAWKICAAAALIYYPTATIFFDRNRALAYVQSGLHIFTTPVQRVAGSDAREALRLVTRQSPDAPLQAAEEFASAASPLRSASR
jgi:transcriptional regulator with XRE-family HTH domain